MSMSTKIYLAGHRGLVGSAVMRRLETGGYTNIITRTHDELDLTRQADVEAFFAAEKPEVVILAAARVGGNPRQRHLQGRVYLPGMHGRAGSDAPEGADDRFVPFLFACVTLG